MCRSWRSGLDAWDRPRGWRAGSARGGGTTQPARPGERQGAGAAAGGAQVLQQYGGGARGGGLLFWAGRQGGGAEHQVLLGAMHQALQGGGQLLGGGPRQNAVRQLQGAQAGGEAGGHQRHSCLNAAVIQVVGGQAQVAQAAKGWQGGSRGQPQRHPQQHLQAPAAALLKVGAREQLRDSCLPTPPVQRRHVGEEGELQLHTAQRAQQGVVHPRRRLQPQPQPDLRGAAGGGGQQGVKIG